MKLLAKKIFRALALIFGPWLIYLFFKFVYLTSKKNFHIQEALPAEPIIFVFWHGNLIMLPNLYGVLRAHKKAKVLISEHFDGRVVARYNELMGLETLAGSTTRGAAKVLISALRAIKAGYDIGITPDGPKGPRYSVSDGAVIMAQKTDTKIMAYNCVPSKFWQVDSWDKTIIPKPFGKLDFYASELISLENMSVEEAKASIYQHLMTLESKHEGAEHEK